MTTTLGDRAAILTLKTSPARRALLLGPRASKPTQQGLPLPRDGEATRVAAARAKPRPARMETPAPPLLRSAAGGLLALLAVIFVIEVIAAIAAIAVMTAGQRRPSEALTAMADSQKRLSEAMAAGQRQLNETMAEGFRKLETHHAYLGREIRDLCTSIRTWASWPTMRSSRRRHRRRRYRLQLPARLVGRSQLLGAGKRRTWRRW